MYGKKIFKIMPAIVLAGFFLCLKSITAFAYPLVSTDFVLKVKAFDKTYEYCYPEIDFYKGELYLKNIEEVVDGIYYDTLVKPISATVEIFPGEENPFKFNKEMDGKCIDKEDLIVQIQNALLKKQLQIMAKQKPIKAEITIEKLKQSTYRRACFSTVYPYSSVERKENIELCARLIGGVTLMPYEVFSFNEKVGERTEKRGFKSAKVIENGKFVDGIGGGVCQVSTTVYNAVLLAGLKVVERHAHSMLVSYVEPSFDAMVSHGYADLRFVNDTGGIVFIVAHVKNDEIFISVYGQKSECVYNRISVVKKEIECEEVEEILSSEIPLGEKRYAVYPKNGAITEGYLEKVKNGKIIEKSLLSVDRYSPLKGLVYYNESQPIS